MLAFHFFQYVDENVHFDYFELFSIKCFVVQMLSYYDRLVFSSLKYVLTLITNYDHIIES